MEITKSEILRFRHLTRLAVETFGGSELAKDAYLIGEETLLDGKKYPYVVSAIIHGNEVGGLASLNEFLEVLLSGILKPGCPVVVFLGNVDASLRDVRFLERDMNRSFNMEEFATHEARRAKELDEVMLGARYYLDIHQTKMHSSTGFFIFPFKKESFEFARELMPRTPIVTHWGTPFSSEGMCSDEYVNSLGGTGITLELGQNGYDPYHVALGFRGIIAGYSFVWEKIFGEPMRGVKESRLTSPGEIYTWANVVPYPESGRVLLDQGWDNFKTISKGQRMGMIDSSILEAPCDGYMIFPNYTIVGSSDTIRPKELYRVMQRITEDHLPSQT